MKKSKNLKNNYKRNKKQLEDYLSDFEPNKKEECKKLFINIDFDCGYSVFSGKMRKILSMPCSGKTTLKYWISRGWDKTKSERLRIKKEYDSSRSPMNINHWINKGYSKEQSIYKIKSQRKTNIEYWLEKGYSKEESIKKRKEFQLKSNKNYVIKYKTDKDFKEQCDKKRTNNINYWLEKGYSEEESIKKIKDRQRTFSKRICIKKHGKERGIKIWEERQKKWLSTLKNSNYNGINGKSVNIKDKIKKYNIEKLINSLSLNNKELFINLFKKCNNIEDFIKEYSKTIKTDNEISLYKILIPLKKLKVLQSFYNTTQNHIMSLIIPKISRTKSMYSNYSWFNNHICRSDGEYIIANFLFKNGIEYNYEKKYNNSVYKCDFYLKYYGLYIEYLGLLKNNNNPYKTKIDFLNKNNINYIASNNINEIKNKILNYVNSSNRRIF